MKEEVSRSETELEPRAKRKVAILGFAPTWKDAPFDNADWEIWGLNELYLKLPRWDRWFEMHTPSLIEHDELRVKDHWAKLATLGCPVFMQDHYADIPLSVPYPIQQIVSEFGDYFTNSISYMLALAIAEGYEEIGIFGVNMGHDTEYCVGPETRVLTDDLRWVSAGSLKVGQQVVGFDEELPAAIPAEYRKYRTATVEKVQELTRPCYRLEMADGSTLISSAEHRWLTLGGLKNARRWLETERLRSRVVYPAHTSKIVKVLKVWEEDRSWEAGYLAAAFDGEGHLTHTNRTNCTSTGMMIGFAQRANSMSAETERCLKGFGFDWGSLEGKEGCTKYSLRGGRSELVRFLGTVRPRRLLEKFDPAQLGCFNAIDDVPILNKEFIGEAPVIGLKTSTGTFIAEGFASHNSYQKPSCEYFVGLARGRGVKVYIPPPSDLLKTPYLYGYHDEIEKQVVGKFRARIPEWETRRVEVAAQMEKLRDEEHQLLGAQQAMSYVLQVLGGGAG